MLIPVASRTRRTAVLVFGLRGIKTLRINTHQNYALSMKTYRTRLLIRYDDTMVDNEVIELVLKELADVKARLAELEAQGGSAEWMDKVQLCHWLRFKNVRTIDRLMA